MRLPHQLTDSQYFLFPSAPELINSLGNFVDAQEVEEISRLSALDLPPVTSREVLALMLGLNPGIIWSYQFRAPKHYRRFSIKKGKGTRQIDAPKVGLKIIQTWLCCQLRRHYIAPSHVFGFVPGRSHVGAAMEHCGSSWVYSFDIANFFPSTPDHIVKEAFMTIGYSLNSSTLLASLCCLRGYLAQGAPTSPIISNMVFSKIDDRLLEIAQKHDVTLTRYADDIVFSGSGEVPASLAEQVESAFSNTPWRLSPQKSELCRSPARLKVHGLLVHGDTVRLTKGYRNRIRAFRHIIKEIGPDHKDYARLRGHINYDDQVQRATAAQKKSSIP